jgi:hypothetical protein
MWGNKVGWILSVFIVGLFGWLLLKLSSVGAPTPPSGEFPYLLSKLDLPSKPEAAVPIFTEQTDAGDRYWKALRLYLENKPTYDNFFTPKQKNFSRVDNLEIVEPAMEQLVLGSKATEAKIFMREPQLLVNYRYPYPELDALYTLGRIAGQIGLSFAAKDRFDDAERYHNAEFALGKRLYDERINVSEMSIGIQLLREATLNLSRLAQRRGDSARKAQLDAFDGSLKSFYDTRIERLSRVVPGIGGQDIRVHAGDVFALASESPDRMWRVEALLKTGRYKYNAGSYWDQLWAKRFLTEPARVGKSDPTKHEDPAVRMAAELARDLTLEGYNQIDVTD